MSQRMNNLAPYLFVEINKKIAAKKALGEEIINFSIGDPDIATPENIIDKCAGRLPTLPITATLKHSDYRS
jgi:aspartate/methionine/tyrosine aminotransferase